MFSWETFPIFAWAAVGCWVFSSFASFFVKKEKKSAFFSTKSVLFVYFAGVLICAAFIVGVWASVGRPPLQTKGETRLWFSFFLSLIGGLIFLFWRYRAMLSFTTAMSSLFLLLNLFKPSLQTQELMPILQSIWFIPHVTIYMCSYAFLGASFLLALLFIFTRNEPLLRHCDKLVTIGLGCFTIGLLLGMIWAKAAWGNFWSWDAKESWALATWLVYSFYLRYRAGLAARKSVSVLLLFLAFFCLQICWWGVNYLPNVRDGLHLYQ